MIHYNAVRQVDNETIVEERSTGPPAYMDRKKMMMMMMMLCAHGHEHCLSDK